MDPNNKNTPNRRCKDGNEREYHQGTEQSKEKRMAHQAQDGERRQGNGRADLKILGDKGKLGMKPTSVTRSPGNLIIVRLNSNVFLIKNASNYS